MSNKKGILGFLYGTAVGRVILKPLTAVWLSKLCGAFLDSRLSKPLIKGFIKNKSLFFVPLYRTIQKYRKGLRKTKSDIFFYFLECGR